MKFRLLLFLLCGASAAAPTRNAAGQESEAATRQYAVAVGFQNQKLYATAIDEWQTFLEKYPADSRAGRAHHYLGTCCLQEEKYTDAVRAFEIVVGKYPSFELLDQSMLNLGIAEFGQARQSARQSDYQRAEAALGRMLKKFPKSRFAGRALYYRAECLYELKKPGEAAAAFDRLVADYPEHELAADSLYAAGSAYEELNQLPKALAAYTSFCERFDSHELITEVQMRMAEIHFKAGEFELAQPVFARVRLNREFELADVAMLRQARCLYERGQVLEAARLYWDVPREFKKTKHYDTAILAGGKCYFLEQKYALARTGLEQIASRRVPEAAEATQWLARCYLKEGDAERARRIAEDGLKRFRDSETSAGLQLVRIDAMFELPRERSRTPELYAKFAQQHARHEEAPQAQYMAALAALESGDHKGAQDYSSQFLTAFPNSRLLGDVQLVAAESRLLQGEYAEAARAYQLFLKRGTEHPNADQAKVRCGLALQMAGRHQEAVDWLKSLVNSLDNPTLRSEALGVLGRCYVGLKQYDPGIETLQLGLRVDPKRSANDEIFLALAGALRETGRDAEADQQLRKLLTDFPESKLAAEAAFRMAESAYRNEQYQQALRSYQDVVTQYGESQFASHAQYGLGWTLFSLGEYEKSIAAMTALIERHRRSRSAPKGLYVRAMASYQLSNFRDAIEDIDSYVRTRPAKNDLLDAEYVRGLSQAGLGDFEAAAATYAKILAGAEGYAAADKVAYELGWTQLELNKPQESVAAFRRLAEDWPESPLAAEGLFRVGEAHYDNGSFADAAVAYQKSAAKSGSGEIAEKALHKLGWSLLKGHQIPAAREAFMEQLRKHAGGPLAGDARFLIGECSFKQDEWETALSTFEKVVRAADSNYVALAAFRAGECAAALEDWESSRKWHQQVVQNHTDFELLPEARYGLGWALQNQGKFEPAISLYESVTEQTQTETAAKARFMIGECCFAQKKHKEAARHFLKAAFLYNHKEWSAMSYFEAARCFEVLKDVEQAVSCYTQLLEKYPQHSKVPEARRRLNELNAG